MEYELAISSDGLLYIFLYYNYLGRGINQGTLPVRLWSYLYIAVAPS